MLAPGEAKAGDYVVFQLRALGSLVEQRDWGRSWCRAVRSLRKRGCGAGGLLQVSCAVVGSREGSCAVTNEAVRCRVEEMGSYCGGCKGEMSREHSLGQCLAWFVAAAGFSWCCKPRAWGRVSPMSGQHWDGVSGYGEMEM